MRAQGDEIHPRSIRASPPRTMRPEVTSPKTTPHPGRAASALLALLVGLITREGVHTLVVVLDAAGGAHRLASGVTPSSGRPAPPGAPHGNHRRVGGLVRRVCVYYALLPLLRLFTLHRTGKRDVAEGEEA